MDLGLGGKRALVLGGGSGLGRATALALAAEGAAVLIAGRTPARLAETRALLRAAHSGPVQTAVVDLGDTTSVDGLIAAAGEVDILLLNGGGPAPSSAASVTEEALRSAFNSMLLAPIRLAQALLPGMRKRGFGRLLVVLSSGVLQPVPNLVVSNAIRLAMAGWLKTLAAEVARDGVTVNGLAPGRIHTERVDFLDERSANLTGRDVEEVRVASRSQIPAGRYGTVEEFGAVAAFFASQQAAYVTGSIVRMDGGMIQAL